nr:EOG090X05UC [Polyphemus pediculus]
MALKGVRVIEMAGLAPAPFCGMILSDFGAEVIRIDKSNSPPLDRQGRGKKSLALNLKSKEGLAVVKKLCSGADVLIEPFRPGVMEKLGLGPEVLTKNNPQLIYARLTGFGQNGPYSSMAGHDINYTATSGLLSLLGRKDGLPQPPQNLLADFAGGGLVCAMGIVMALFERGKSNLGQVIDASMVEGAAYVGSWIYKSQDMPIWSGKRGSSWFDGGIHNYETYQTKDGKFMTVGALEPQFYQELSRLLSQAGIEDIPEQYPNDMEAAKARLTEIFLTKTQKEWQAIFDGTDACVVPVSTLEEAPHHPHNVSRGSFIRNANGQYEPTPAPRLSRTPAQPMNHQTEPSIGENSVQVLQQMGYSSADIDELIRSGAIYQAKINAKL